MKSIIRCDKNNNELWNKRRDKIIEELRPNAQIKLLESGPYAIFCSKDRDVPRKNVVSGIIRNKHGCNFKKTLRNTKDL